MLFRTAFLSCAALVLAAQGASLKPLRPSPAATVIQEAGMSTVKIEYCRPGVKGRKIWGELVPTNEPWRAGANDATVITMSHPATIAGKSVPAGSYALFVIPGNEKWTWILNKVAKQWGTYAYKADQDVLRFDAPMVAVPHGTEWMAFDLDLANPDTVKVVLRWEKRSSSFEVAFDTKGLYWAHIEETLKTAQPKDPAWLQAANYCINNKTRLDKAAEWLEVSFKAGVTFRNRTAKANLLKAEGKLEAAKQELDGAIALAKDPASKASKETVEYLEKMKADWAAGK